MPGVEDEVDTLECLYDFARRLGPKTEGACRR